MEFAGDSHDGGENSFAFETNAHASEGSSQKPNALLVDGGATAHIITDESKFNKFDNTFKPDKHYTELANGTRSNSVVLKRWDVEIRIKDLTGKLIKGTLKDALYIPTYPQDILSLQAATERGATVTLRPDSAEFVSNCM